MTTTIQDKAIELCERLSQEDSILDSNHIREGVVVRVEAPGFETHYKYKSANFCILENIMKNDIDFIDPEDVA